MTSNLRRHAVRHLRSFSLRAKERPEAITTPSDQASLTACAPYTHPLQWRCTRNVSSASVPTTAPSCGGSKRREASPCRSSFSLSLACLPRPGPACPPRRPCWAAPSWSVAAAAGHGAAAFGTLAIPGLYGSEAVSLYGGSGGGSWSAALLAARRLPRQPEPFEDEYEDDEYEDGEWVDLDDEDMINDLGMLDGGEDEFDAVEDENEEGGKWEEAEEEEGEAPPPPPNPRPSKDWRKK